MKTQVDDINRNIYDIKNEDKYEGHGPNGVAIIIEAMTDNRN